MGYLDNYKNRLGTSGNVRESRKHTAKAFIDDTFSNSPSYTTFTVDGKSADGLLQQSKNGELRIILLRPDTVCVRGSYVNINGEDWLLTDVSGNDVYPKVMVQRCNDTIVWIDENDVVQSYSAVMNSDATLYQFGFIPDRMMQIVNMEFHAFLKYDDNTSKLKENRRFVLNGKAFNTIAIDAISKTVNNQGIIRLHLKADIVRENDDKETGVADNSKPKSGGGKLW